MPHKIMPIRQRGRFFFERGRNPESFFFGTLPNLLRSWWSRHVRHPDGHRDAWHAPDGAIDRSVHLQITWIGHATFLIQVGGFNILTDPIFGDASPLFKRVIPPGIEPDALPPIDVILLSHNHPDHMDHASLVGLRHANPQVAVLVPEGDGQWFARRKFKKIAEHTWWDFTTIAIGESTPLRCTFVPAAHWSRRGLLDTNKSLWGGWVISWGDQHIYFAGDTAYAHHFKSIVTEFPSIDVALLPIGPCEPQEWMKHTHMGPDDAGKAFLELDATHFIPMHWGTFLFGEDSLDVPPKRLQAWWDDNQVQLGDKRLQLLKVGQRLKV